MEKQCSGPFNKPQAFALGVLAGVLVLCTIGFFIMLGLYLNDGGTKKTGGEETIIYPEKFSQCLDSGKYTAAVKADAAIASQLGINSTPSLLLNGYLAVGAFPYANLSQVVDSLLAGKAPDMDFLKNDEGKIIRVDVPELPNAVWKGAENAVITLVEFSDFQCPYCSQYSASVEQILANYGDKVRFTYRHLPLSFHPQAQKAAEAFECAKEQGKAYEMHDQLFVLADSDALSVETMKK